MYTFKDGARQMEPIQFDAHESKTFIVEWDWAREGITPDWSVTAWAEQGQVAVSHVNGTTSDTLPFIARVDESGEETSSNTGFSNAERDLIEPTSSVEVDSLQQILNDFVLGYEIDSVAGFCGFRLLEVFDD